MAFPPLVHYQTIDEYRTHYENTYCKQSIQTADRIPVFFHRSKFDHAFFESTNRNGIKDTSISTDRATRIDWIKATLENNQASLFAGWDKTTKTHGHDRRVAVVHGDFVVIVALSLNTKGLLKANFVTCFNANNSIAKITSAPTWSRDLCLRTLKGR